MKRRCLICEQELENGLVDIQAATVWTTQGGYDSTVYDPMTGGVHLEAVICDSCLVRKKEFIEEVTVTRQPEIIERRPADL